MINVKVKKLQEDITVPALATAGAACFDLRASHDAVVEPGRLTQIGTGLAMEIPEGYGLDLIPRSGYAFKHQIRLVNCIAAIDSDFRDEVMIGLFMETPPAGEEREPYQVKAGDRIAQGRLVPVLNVHFEEVDELSKTDRKGGLGSSGVK